MSVWEIEHWRVVVEKQQMAIEIYCWMWQKITIRIFFIHLIEKVPILTHTHSLLFGWYTSVRICFFLSLLHILSRSGSLRITINTHTFTFLLSSIYFLFQLLFGFPILLFFLFLFLFVGMPLLSEAPSERSESTDGFSKSFTLCSMYCQQERQEYRRVREKKAPNKQFELLLEHTFRNRFRALKINKLVCRFRHKRFKRTNKRQREKEMEEKESNRVKFQRNVSQCIK